MKNLKRPGAVFAAAFTAALLIILSACPGAGLDTGGNPYDGTVWEGKSTLGAGAGSLSFLSDTEWQIDFVGSQFKGTYTYDPSGSPIVMTLTHTRSDFNPDWTLIPPNYPGEKLVNVAVEDNALMWGFYIFVKQGGSRASPYDGTVWEAPGGAQTYSFVSDTEWRMISGAEARKGTYGYFGSGIYFAVTHERSGSGAAWTLVEDNTRFVGIVLNDSLAVDGSIVDGSVFLKQGGAWGGSPHHGTSWRYETASGVETTYTFMSGAGFLRITVGSILKGTYTYDDSGAIVCTVTHDSPDYGATWEVAPVTLELRGIILGDGLSFLDDTVFFNLRAGAGDGSPYYRTFWTAPDGWEFCFLSGAHWLMRSPTAGTAHRGTYNSGDSSITITKTHITTDSGVTWEPEENQLAGTVPVTSNTFEYNGHTFTKSSD